MAIQLELELLAEELEQVVLLPEAGRWTIERDDSVPLGVFVTLHPISNPTHIYRARLRWGDYFGPPSLKFVSLRDGSINDPTAWPKCFGFRPGSLDACLPWTQEGHGHHPEWRNSPTHAFPQVEVPLQYALLRLLSSLDSTYEGRGP